MFPDGMPDMQALFQQAAAMQEQLQSASEDLANARVTGNVGGGLVEATVTGTGELVGLIIDPQACDPSDTETLADLVVAAVHDAQANAQQMAADEMGDITGGLGGLGDLGAIGDLGGLLGGAGGGSAVAGDAVGSADAGPEEDGSGPTGLEGD